MKAFEGAPPFTARGASYGDGTVHLRIDEQVATVMISRPEVCNALNVAVIEGLRQVAAVLAPDDGIRAVVLVGEGSHFSAGADITVAVNQNDEASARRWIRLFRDGVRQITALPQPVVAAIEGYALGGGCELALWCDLRVVSESARLGVPEVKIGVLPAAGGTQLLPRLVGRSMAFELLLLGEPISGRRAKEIGLAVSVVPTGEALGAASAMAEHLSALSPLAMRAIKDAVTKAEWMPLDDALEQEMWLGAELFGTDDRREGMSAFLEKRPPLFRNR